MKKILTVSLVAIMAVSAARADIASTGYVTDRTGDVELLETTAKNLTGAVNELKNSVGGANGAIGDLATLTTDEKGTVVGAINEVNANADKGISDAAAAKAIADENKAAIEALDTDYASQAEIDAITADYLKAADKTELSGLISAAQTKADQGVTDAAAAMAAAEAADAKGAKGITDAAAALAAAQGAQSTADGKQPKSGAAYTVGTENGSWTTLKDLESAACPTDDCVLTFDSTGNPVWTKIVYGVSGN